MKRIATALCLSSIVLAAPAVQAQWQCNWLVGISGGWLEQDGNINVTLNDTTNVTQPLTLISTGAEHSGWDWGILGGYQVRCNGWLMGLELEVDWAGHNHNNNFQFVDSNNRSWAGTAHYKRDTNVGLTARLGYQVSPCLLPYVRAGIETSRDKVSFTGATTYITGTTNPVTHYINGSADGSRRSYRGVFGVGAEMPIPMVCGLSFRAEYDYHTNGRNVDSNVVANDRTTIVSASGKHHANSVIAALVWNFL